jgi:hypothetical protein
VLTPCRTRTTCRREVTTVPHSRGRDVGFRAFLSPSLGVLMVASVLVSGCQSNGVSLTARVRVSQPCVDTREMLRQPIDGFGSAAIGPGGRLALGNQNGPIFTLGRDTRGSVLPTKFLWLVQAPPGTTVVLTARAVKTNSLVDWVVTDPTTKRASTTKTFRALVQPLDPHSTSKWGDVPSLLQIRTPGCYEVVTTVQKTRQTFRLQATK